MLHIAKFISAITGPGGKIIQEFRRRAELRSISEVNGEGIVEISNNNKDSLDTALAMVRAIVVMPEIGEVYHARVTSMIIYGCFVEFLPGKEGLLHLQEEIDWKRFQTIEETGLKEGDELDIKLLDVDPKDRQVQALTQGSYPQAEAALDLRTPKRGDRPGVATRR